MKKDIFNKTYLIPGSIVGVTMLAGGILTLPATRAEGSDTSVSTATITVPVACSMIGVVDTPHTAEIPNGIDSRGSDYYPDGIGQTTLKAYCNDSEGFSIYAVGYSDDTIGNTYLRDATLGQDEDIQTSTTFSGTDSAWAMKIGVTSGNYPAIVAGSSSDTEKESGDLDYSIWQAIPSSYTRIAYRNAATDIDNDSIASAEGSSVTTTYAAYISTTQNAGTYVGKVKYTLVHPASEEPLQPQTATSGCINYFANASTAVGSMGCQSISSSATSATLLAGNFSRTGYGFAGWSDSYDYATNANAKFYGPQEYITFTAGQYTGTNDGLALYAVWVKSEGSLQDTSKVSSICSGLTTAPTDGTANLASVSALTDQRDSQTYAVAKLADGQCWMIENLRLESTNSDNSIGALAQGYGTSSTYGNFSGLSDAESTGFTSTYTANSLYYSGTQEGTASIDIGTSNYPAYRMPRYNNTNTSARASTPTTNSSAMYSYGNYYTWAAAIADTTYYNTNNSSVTNTSLCPAGWHLPTGGSVTTAVNVTETPSTWREFYNLGYGIMGSVANDSNAGTYAYYNNTTTNSNGDTATKAFRKFPNNFLYSGYFNTSSAVYRGSYGYYWSSTANGNGNSYYLYLNSSNVYPGTDYSSKYSGLSIRCVSGS
ncbi:MAG: FISUMP domain-containing protein [Candidatus Saccharibacteria bacterium]|nr:FISUMP domain-containing protein [Candidatus Saccharibacteria bacterium]